MYRRLFATALAVLLLGLLAALPAAAEPRTSSDLLLPYFEVDLGGSRTTLFAVGNAHDGPVQVRATVATNWGIPVLGVTLDLAAGEVVTVNLRDWIEAGRLPTQTLGREMLAHVQSALTGQPSPRDGKYYGSEVGFLRAAGFVTLRVQTPAAGRPDSLWGDYFWIDAGESYAGGELLVDIDQVRECSALCERHLVRFLEGGAFDGGTELVIWTGRVSAPSPVPEPLYMPVELSGDAFYRESGARFDQRILHLMPTQVIPIAELGLSESFGWIDVVSEEPVYVGVRYAADDRFAVAVQSWCLEERPSSPPFHQRPSVDLQKLTAGADADLPPGPALEIGSPVTWEYVLTNTGNVAVSGIVVTDNRGVAVSCPATRLARGATMTCTGSGTVQAGQYANVGTVTANGPTGEPITDSDPSHYLGVQFVVGEPAIAIEKLTNGQDADTPPGPSIGKGSPVTWTYMVTNVGGVGLTAVSVADSDASVAVACPETSLAIGEAMICSATGTATEGLYENTAVATALGAGEAVSASDPSHYFGLPQLVTDLPAIEIEKLTNGYDADGVASAPQLPHGHPVVWTYVVTNSGNVTLTNVAVTDDQGVEVSCPKTVLEPGEQMICTGSGTALAGDECYENVGTVVGTPPEGDNVTDSDPSHYCAEEVPGEAAIHVEKYTNGQDADVAPGPTLHVGDNVQWVYVVTNPGDVTLVGITVTDDQGAAVTCPGGQPFLLEPGDARTCFANGTATAGQYANVGTASGEPEGGGDSVSDSDPSHYFGDETVEEPAIALEKLIAGQDADTPTGPVLTVGDPVMWTYVVTNTGNVRLTGVTVDDDQEGVASCPKTALEPGESMTCTLLGTVEAGQYANLGAAEGSGGGTTVSDSDPCHYFGRAECRQGCTPGYWKNHSDSWPPTGYTTTQKVKDVFGEASFWPGVGNANLIQALSFDGGSGTEGAAEILLRAAVAALLNASHPDVCYPRTPAQVLASVNAALASHQRDTMLTLAASLDADNNLGCPLS